MSTETISNIRKYQVYLQTMRGPFLILTPVCIFLALSTAIADHNSVSVNLVVMALIGGMLAHISVNTLNEYHDFKSGLDFNTRRTRFSGGSGSLPQNPEYAPLVQTLGITSLIATLLVGVYFIWSRGIYVIPIGLIGLVLIITYTRWITRYALLCLIAPGLGFGAIMVAGTHYIFVGDVSNLVWLSASVPFFLINNLLLLNQYPDIKADTDAGRNHLPIAFGVKTSNLVYLLFAVIPFIVILYGVSTEEFPLASLLTLLPLSLALYTFTGASRYGKEIGNHPQYMAANVITAITTPLLLGLTLLIK